MKTLKILSVIVLSSTVLSLRAQQSITGQTGKINPEFQKQLGVVTRTAGELSNEFATDDASKVDAAAKAVKDAISSTDMHLLEGQDHMTWMTYMSRLNEQIVDILTEKDLSSKREAFAAFNDTLHKSVTDFGVKDAVAYYQFCPMALNSKGAYWFSNAKEIRNPYLGTKMLTCGSTKEILQ